MIEVHEIHDWPERAIPGPRIIVWYGRNRIEAEAALKRQVDSHQDSPIRFGIVERDD